MKVIIDGVTYIPEKQAEKKQERLSGYLIKSQLQKNGYCSITHAKCSIDDTRMIEILDGEIILDEDTTRNKLAKYIRAFQDMQQVLIELGFKKDGE